MKNETPDLVKKILAGGFAEDGWAGLDPSSPQAKKMSYEQELKNFQTAKEIAEPFLANPAALQHLRDITLLYPTWKVDELGLVNGIGYGIFREGQNSIMRYIEGCIALAQAGPPEDPEKPQTEGE